MKSSRFPVSKDSVVVWEQMQGQEDGEEDGYDDGRTVNQTESTDQDWEALMVY
jgi:hypothetical protein